MKSILGDEKQVNCIACGLQSGEIQHFGERVAETDSFDVSQDYEIPIPGFFILASKEHKKGIGDFSVEQCHEFIELLRKTRIAMEQSLGIEYVNLIQEEDSITRDSHFHLWLMPQHEWMKLIGTRVSDARAIIKYAKENLSTKENLEDVSFAVKKVKAYLSQ